VQKFDAERLSLGKLTDEVKLQDQVKISNRSALSWSLDDNQDLTIPLTLLSQLPSLWIAKA